MNDELRSLLPSIGALGTAAVIAAFLTLTRGWAESRKAHVRGAVRIALIAILVQSAHFGEELFTGFHERFPALFDLPPMSLRFFVAFNLAWIVLWLLSAWGMAEGFRVALFPLWFLAIASLMNGIAHPLLCIPERGYFPGLVTSPVVGVLGFVLWRRLRLVTRDRKST